MFPIDTTVLTLEGWKGYNELSTKDQVATFNRITEEIEYQTPVEIVCKKNYSGELIHIHNRNTNQLLTPDHKVLVKKRFQKNYQKLWDSSWSFELAKTLPKVAKAKRYLRLLVAGKYRQGTRSIGNYYAELLGWILTDGDFESRCRAIRINQSSKNIEKVIRIWNVLNVLKKTLGTKFNVTPQPVEWKGELSINYRFYLNASDFTERIRRDIPNKKPTWKLLQLKQTELACKMKGQKKAGPSLFTGLLGGDAHFHTKKSSRFGQKDPRTREWVQALCVLIGCRSKDSPDTKYTPIVYICGRDTTEITNRYKNRPHIIVKQTKTPLKMWGVEIANKTVVCRRTILEKNITGEKGRQNYVFITSGGVVN